MGMYLGDAMYEFRLQSGDWPDCDLTWSGSLDGLRESLREALLRDGLAFSYWDGNGEADASVMNLGAPVPCGGLAAVALVPGWVQWRSTRTPKPGRVWTLGEELAAWISDVPWITDSFTATVSLTWLSARGTGDVEGGLLYPEPDSEETSIE